MAAQFGLPASRWDREAPRSPGEAFVLGQRPCPLAIGVSDDYIRAMRPGIPAMPKGNV